MIYRWDDYSVDDAARRVIGPEGEVHVEPQVFDVLAMLITERARVVSKEDILETVWGDQFVSESALTTRIKQARRAVGDDGRSQKYIRNVHGRGYQFIGDISNVAPDAALSARSNIETARPETVSTSPLDLARDITVDTEFPFVGRASELEQITDVLRHGTATNARVFIGGSPGSGKSRLAIEVLDQAVLQDTMVCAGRCEANVTSGLQAVRDAFTQLANTYPDSVVGWSSGVEGQLVSLIPSLVKYLDNEPIPVDSYAGIDVFLTVFERIVATQPLIILVDDLQWSDEPTRAFLGRLHRRLRGQQVATLGTFRSGRADLPDEVHRWIQDECRSENSLRLKLGDLDDTAASELVHAVLGDAGDGIDTSAQDLIATTAGHSLFLTESLRDLQQGQDTANSVAELIGRRLARQAEDVQRIIRAGAILGPEFAFKVAAEAAGLEPGPALDAIDAAIDAELLHETGSRSRFRFSHQLVPQAIVDRLSRSRRASLHGACAEALTGAGADDVEVAFHMLGAIPIVPMDDAVLFSRSAAAAARAANQFDRALRVLEAVHAAEPDTRVRTEVLLEMGQIINSQGTPGLALKYLEDVTDAARKNGWTDLFVAAALAHWNQSPFRKPHDRATLALLDEADSLLGESPSIDKAKVTAKTAVFNVFRQPLEQRAASIDTAFEIAEAASVTDVDRLVLLEYRHITFSSPAGAHELDKLDPEIERLRSEAELYFTDAAAPETSALVMGRGSLLREVTQGDSDRMAAQPIAEWRDFVTKSMFAAFEGDIASARDLCDRAAEIGEAYWGDSSFALHGFGQFFLDLVSDDWTRSAELMELLVTFDGSSVFRGALAAACHANGEVDKALTLIDETNLSGLSLMGEHILGGNGLVGFAEAALRLDHSELADAVEQELLRFETLVMGVPWACSLAAADPLARLAARRGDHDAADRHRARALELYETLDAPFLAARVS